MLSETAALWLFAFVAAFAIAAVVASIIILRKGKLYHHLKPAARPRRWVLVWLLVLLAVFAVWFPIWTIWPRSFISRVLTVVFGVTFGVVGITLRRLSGLVDWYYKRKGWPLR
jgi:hypothetical protein